jgi:hypothetical protein
MHVVKKNRKVKPLTPQQEARQTARAIRNLMQHFTAQLHRPKVMMDDCVKIWREFHKGEAVWHMDRYSLTAANVEQRWTSMWMDNLFVLACHNVFATHYKLNSSGSIYLVPIPKENANGITTSTTSASRLPGTSQVDARDLLEEFDSGDHSSPVSASDAPAESTSDTATV